MSITEIKEQLELLLIQLKNLRKSPNRKRSRESAAKKIHEISNICDNINKIQNEVISKAKYLLRKEEINSLLEKAKEYKQKALKIINDNIKEDNSDNEGDNSDAEHKEGNKSNEFKIEDKKDTKIITMAEFDYGVAQKLPMLSIEREDKRTESIRDFLNNVQFYHDTLSERGKTTLITFVVKCKIQGKTLTELGATSPTKFEDLKQELNKKCGSKETIETIQTKLNNTRQGQKSMRDYVNEIENLITKMTDLEVSSQGEEARPHLKVANERRGLSFLKKGVGEKYKFALDCARHTSFQEATQHLLELEPSMGPQTDSIKYMTNQNNSYKQNWQPSQNYQRSQNYNLQNFQPGQSCTRRSFQPNQSYQGMVNYHRQHFQPNQGYQMLTNYNQRNWQPNLRINQRQMNNMGNNFVNPNNNTQMNRFQKSTYNTLNNNYNRNGNNQQNRNRNLNNRNSTNQVQTTNNNNNYGNYRNYNSNNNRNTNNGAVVEYNPNNRFTNPIRTLLAIEETGNEEPTDGTANRSEGTQ